MLSYRIAQLEDMNKVANVHIQCFKDYFLTSFGQELISKYYEEFFLEENLFVIVSNEENEIIGFAMGYIHGSKARDKFEEKYRYDLAKNLIFRCIKFEKLALRKCLLRAKDILISKVKKMEPTKEINALQTSGELLSICVLPQWRGLDIAQNLIFEYEKLLLEKDVQNYSLTVLCENARACNFYEKCGFVLAHKTKSEMVYSKKLK